jgi:DNA-binding LacI/PurR family transcriptional regulator
MEMIIIEIDLRNTILEVTMSSIKEVAKIAGVSTSTVSRVINNKGGSISISKATRDRVQAVISDLNYKPNYAARRLKSKEIEQSIGIYIPWGWGFVGFSSFIAKLIETISKYLKPHHYNITLLFYEPGTISTYYNQLSSVRSHFIDGMIITGSNHKDIQFLETVSKNAAPPFIIVHRELKTGSFVVAANREGAKELVRRLYIKGHKRIALISTPISTNGEIDYVYNERFQGYREALQQQKLYNEKLVYYCDTITYKEIHKVVQEILALENPPTAILTSRDSLALYTIRSLHLLGLTIPNDIEIASFSDNTDFMKMFSSHILSAIMPVEEMGKAAVEYLVEQIKEGREIPRLQKQIPYHISIESNNGTE